MQPESHNIEATLKRTAKMKERQDKIKQDDELIQLIVEEQFAR